MDNYKVTAIIVAAGRGKRMEMNINKQFININSKPILAYTLEVFQDCEAIDEIVLVAPCEAIDYCKEEIVDKYYFSKVKEIVAGGKERAQSVKKGIDALPLDSKLVLIHDGARPLVTKEIINNTISVAMQHNAAIVAVPLKDTVKRVSEKMEVVETLDRKEIWAIQTPQAFSYHLLKSIYEKEEVLTEMLTDDAMLFEKMGYGIKVVMGCYKNIKITTPEDIVIAEAFLAKRGEKND